MTREPSSFNVNVLQKKKKVLAGCLMQLKKALCLWFHFAIYIFLRNKNVNFLYWIRTWIIRIRKKSLNRLCVCLAGELCHSLPRLWCGLPQTGWSCRGQAVLPVRTHRHTLSPASHSLSISSRRPCRGSTEGSASWKHQAVVKLMFSGGTGEGKQMDKWRVSEFKDK